jgi:hypothetical protein
MFISCRVLYWLILAKFFLPNANSYSSGFCAAKDSAALSCLFYFASDEKSFCPGPEKKPETVTKVYHFYMYISTSN